MNMQAACPTGGMTRGRTMPPIDKLSTYMPCGGDGTYQQMLISIKARGDIKKYCESMDCTDQLRMHFTIGCGIPGDSGDHITFGYGGENPADLLKAIVCTINQSPTLNAQGHWTIEGETIEYRGNFPNVNVNIEWDYDPAKWDVQVIAEVPAASGKAQNLEHGTVAHTPRLEFGKCGSDSSDMSGRPCAKIPSQDPAAAVATEIYAGIVVDRPYGARGGANGKFPFFGDCNDCCKPESCIELVCGCCTEVDLLVEEWVGDSVPSTLYYRIAPSGKHTKLGRFALAEGTGLIPFKKSFTPIARNGQYLVVKFH
jgi:hypothetical protein